MFVSVFATSTLSIMHFVYPQELENYSSKGRRWMCAYVTSILAYLQKKGYNFVSVRAVYFIEKVVKMLVNKIGLLINPLTDNRTNFSAKQGYCSNLETWLLRSV